MVKCLIALTSLFAATATAVPVWTWVDESGHRHYSDRPVEGATQIEVGTSQTFATEAPQPNRGPANAGSEPETETDTGTAYSAIDVVSPEPEQTLSNIGGEMTLELSVDPALREGHSIGIVYDGRTLAPSSRSLSITLTEVYRGEHTIEAVIVDANGEELIRSAPVTFYVRQTSIRN